MWPLFSSAAESDNYKIIASCWVAPLFGRALSVDSNPFASRKCGFRSSKCIRGVRGKWNCIFFILPFYVILLFFYFPFQVILSIFHLNETFFFKFSIHVWYRLMDTHIQIFLCNFFWGTRWFKFAYVKPIGKTQIIYRILTI